MKALTISQPFASLIVDGEKKFENRTWECLYRGYLAIHAGKGTQYLDKQELAKYPTSQIIGVCRVANCLHVPSIRDAVRAEKGFGSYSYDELCEMFYNEHFEGPYAIILDDITKLDTPIVISGKQGLWNVPAEFVQQLESALPVPF